MSFYGSRMGRFGAKSLLDTAMINISTIEVPKVPPTLWGPGAIGWDTQQVKVPWATHDDATQISQGSPGSFLEDWGWVLAAAGGVVVIGVGIYLARKS